MGVALWLSTGTGSPRRPHGNAVRLPVPAFRRSVPSRIPVPLAPCPHSVPHVPVMIVDTAWNNALISLLQIVEDEMIKLSLTRPLYSS